MSSTLRKYLNILNFIASIKDVKVRRGFLKQFSDIDDFYAALQEIAENTVRQVIPLSTEEKIKLRPHKKKIKNFIRTSKSSRIRKEKFYKVEGSFQCYFLFHFLY